MSDPSDPTDLQDQSDRERATCQLLNLKSGTMGTCGFHAPRLLASDTRANSSTAQLCASSNVPQNHLFAKSLRSRSCRLGSRSDL